MLDDLYREIVLDHYKSPKNRGTIENPDIRATGMNPLCGDELELTVLLDGDTIREIKFDGHGCSISQASASMLTQEVKAKRLKEAEDLVNLVRGMFKGEVEVDVDELGDLEALQGIRQFPVRIKCATLAWNALQVGIDGHRNGEADTGSTTEETVFTEQNV